MNYLLMTVLSCSAVTGCASNGTKDAEPAAQSPATSAGTAKEASASGAATTAQGPHAKPGFATKVVEGRLWVFRLGSKELEQFEKQGELAKHVTRVGAGPDRMTIKAPDAETLDAYLVTKAGFVTKIVEGRLWVFRLGSKELEQFEEQGELAKHVTRIGVGPGKMTVKAPDGETIDAYLSAK